MITDKFSLDSNCYNNLNSLFLHEGVQFRYSPADLLGRQCRATKNIVEKRIQCHLPKEKTKHPKSRQNSHVRSMFMSSIACTISCHLLKESIFLLKQLHFQVSFPPSILIKSMYILEKVLHFLIIWHSHRHQCCFFN